MRDLLTALALAVMLEGVVYALFPSAMRRMLAAVAEMPPSRLRLMGLGGATVGLLAVWAVRSAMMAP